MRAFFWSASIALVTMLYVVGCGRDSAPPAAAKATPDKSAAAAHGHDHAAGNHDHGDHEHADGHDHHDVPITEADVQMPANYAEAVTRIQGYRDAIRSAATGAEPELAHRPLDELDIVLNRLPEIARDSGVPKQQWEAINTGARELRNLFNQVHAAIDEHHEPDYAAVAQPIDEQIAKLTQALATP